MQKTLVIQLARFGDLLQSKRLLLSVAADGDAVHLAVDKSLAPLAEALYPFAHVHAIPAHAAAASESEVFPAARKAFQTLAGEAFDTVYNLNISPLSLALVALFPARIVRGYAVDNGQPLRSTWCRMAARWTGERRISPLNLVDFWAHFHPAPVAPNAVNPAARAGANGRVGIVMAGRQSRRSLPVAVLGKVVEAVFKARSGPELVCLGSSQETPLVRRLARELSSQAGQKIVDTTGKTGLKDLPDLVGGLDLVLTPDTGLMHLAAHLGVPVQAFFLSSAWTWETGPYGEGHTVWQAVEPCSPCLESRPCPRDVACLACFSQPGFLERMGASVSMRSKQGRAEGASPWPEGMLCLESGFDSLGVVYAESLGHDSREGERQARRRLICDYLGLAHGEAFARPAGVELFYEADWMLPDPVPSTPNL